MLGFLKGYRRRALVVVHDLTMTALALLASFYIRFEEVGLTARLPMFLNLLPALLLYAGAVYWFFDLYRSKWRFASLPDLLNILRASTVMALSMLALDYVLLSPNFFGTFFFGKITIVLYWILQMGFLSAPRMAYRYFRYKRSQDGVKNADALPSLLIGSAADAEVLLRSIENGAIKKVRPVGILSPSSADQGQVLRGVPVLGRLDSLERIVKDMEIGGTRIARVIFTPSAMAPELHPEAAVMSARRLGLTISRMPSLAESGDDLRLAPINVEDLLLRPSAKIEYDRLESFVRGKSIVVTGGGGSIGAEICERVIAFGAGKLLILENSEPALHAIMEQLNAKSPKSVIEGRIADVRDRDRMFKLIGAQKPDLVFHAAALKHVPLLESDWMEGIKTNVFGSINVIDAASAAGPSAVVLISTDKAIEPVSVLGATKRFAEMYCQALDADPARPQRNGRPMRIVSVRFGNVLASNGSVVPKFKAQIEAGGPVTVTHPDMLRYFMTIREACDLVITAARHAIEDGLKSDVSIYVLNMGQPVKIVDLATRMIRLVGLEPGRDIDIVFSGVRPGERLQEILFAQEEPAEDIGVSGIVAARPPRSSLQALQSHIGELKDAVEREDRRAAFDVLGQISTEFQSHHSVAAK